MSSGEQLAWPETRVGWAAWSWVEKPAGTVAPPAEQPSQPTRPLAEVNGKRFVPGFRAGRGLILTCPSLSVSSRKPDECVGGWGAEGKPA